jgi:hypothetical protein
MPVSVSRPYYYIWDETRLVLYSALVHSLGTCLFPHSAQFWNSGAETLYNIDPRVPGPV